MSSSQFINTDELALTQENGRCKLVIHPGPNNGQDVYVDYAPEYDTTVNQNYVPELPVNSWNWAGGVTTRSFIKFPQLKKIPVSAEVLSAKLYLYTAEHFLNHPQGNNGDNRCLVQRVIGHNWWESTLT
jgi:hypothetical protein